MRINASPCGYVWKRHGVFRTDSDITMNTICLQIRPPVAQFKIPYAVPADNEINQHVIPIQKGKLINPWKSLFNPGRKGLALV